MSTTPYAGTEGFSGTDTSRERAESKAAGARRRQNAILRYLAERGSKGATVVDVKRAPVESAGPMLSDEFKHHGTASGTLSILHRAGRIARLSEIRDKAHVYVLPEHIDGRPYQAFVGNRERAQVAALDDAVTELEALRPGVSPVDRVGIDVATAHLRAMIERLLS